MSFKRTKFPAIKCQLCGYRFLRITNTHLWKEHKITMEEYKQRFPGAPIDTKGLPKRRVYHLTDKTYEEVYGEEKGRQLRMRRKIDASKQMQLPEQIAIRKDKCGYEITEEHKKKLSELKFEHGFFNYRKRALEYYGLECARCGKTSENPGDFIVHHKNLNSFPSELGDHSIENLMVLCRSCHAKFHNELNNQVKRFSGINSIEKGVHYMLKGLKDEMGLDLHDENFQDTPKRIARAYAEIFSGIQNTQDQVASILESAFPSGYDEMIAVKNIEVFSMCPHHFLPVRYEICTAYIPSKEGDVIGISKMARLVEILAKRPILQETLTDDITNSLMKIEKCRGAICLVKGVHYCMVMRGVKKSQSQTITTSLKGLFSEDSSAKSEFMQLIKE